MRVLLVGEPDNGFNCSAHNARALATLGVQSDFDAQAGWRTAEWKQQCRQADAVHLVTYVQQNWMLLRKLWRASMMGLPIIRYWVGSDCLWARFHEPTRRFAQALDHLGVTNLAVADHLVDELAQIDIQAQYTPIITPHIWAQAKPHALPKQLTVLCYLTTQKRRFYGADIIDRLIKDLPQVHFIVLCDGDTDYSGHPNVESLGLVDDLDRVMARCTVHVRPTLHDGMPRLMLEMLSRGRHAICTQAYPHCHRANTLAEFKSVLSRLQASADFNLPGREYVCKHFETARTTACLLAKINEAVSRQAVSPNSLLATRHSKLLLRCPWMLSRKCVPLPRHQDLPDEAEPLRVILQGYQQAGWHQQDETVTAS